ncbi:MAG TPA: hypothetical protein VNO25_19930 [Streptosporangiaceae bacterium]|nr:hypothetical protein [Streptosporangiaceae bacterium]
MSTPAVVWPTPVPAAPPLTTRNASIPLSRLKALADRLNSRSNNGYAPAVYAPELAGNSSASITLPAGMKTSLTTLGWGMVVVAAVCGNVTPVAACA